MKWPPQRIRLKIQCIQSRGSTKPGTGARHKKKLPYDPLKKESPDITSGAMDRAVGGLGIFLVQKYADGMSYEYKGGENCLTIRKKLK